MSLVLGVAFTNKAVIISDGRAINKSTISENCDKTRKINNNVILGFSGELEFSLWLLEQFDNICNKDIFRLKADHIANILCRLAQEGINYRKNLKESVSTNFQMIVAGKNSKGIIGLYSFGVPTNFKIKEDIPVEKNFVYSVLFPDTKGFDYSFEQIIADCPNKRLEDCINLLYVKAAKIDDTINTNLFIKEIELIETNNKVSPKVSESSVLQEKL